ncbi:hypothetical protein ACFQ0B_61740 [Nonomuraea thailandensis]
MLHPTRTDVVVLRMGEVVVKAHSARDDAEALRPRLRAVASASVSGVMLPRWSARCCRRAGAR